MPDEQVNVSVNTGESATEPAAAEEEEDVELDYLTEMVAQESIVREEQHEELMEVVGAWQARLEELSQLRDQLMSENPMLVQIQRQISELQGQLNRFEESLTKRQSSESAGDRGAGGARRTDLQTGETQGTGSTEAVEPSIQEISSDRSIQPPAKKRKFTRI